MRIAFVKMTESIFTKHDGKGMILRGLNWVVSALIGFSLYFLSSEFIYIESTVVYVLIVVGCSVTCLAMLCVGFASIFVGAFYFDNMSGEEVIKMRAIRKKRLKILLILFLFLAPFTIWVLTTF